LDTDLGKNIHKYPTYGYYLIIIKILRLKTLSLREQTLVAHACFFILLLLIHSYPVPLISSLHSLTPFHKETNVSVQNRIKLLLSKIGAVGTGNEKK